MLGVARGQELADRLRRGIGDGDRGQGALGIENGPGKAGIEDHEGVFGAGQPDEGAEAPHRQRLQFKGGAGIGARRIGRHQIAFPVDRMAVARIPDEESRVRRGPLDDEESLQRGLQVHRAEVQPQGHVEAALLQRAGNAFRVLGRHGEARPTTGIGVDPDDQRFREPVEFEFAGDSGAWCQAGANRHGQSSIGTVSRPARDDVEEQGDPRSQEQTLPAHAHRLYAEHRSV